MSNYTAKEISTFLCAANTDLGSHKYAGDEMIPDYCKAVIIGQQLQGENKRLRDALQSLHDQQNGPPLIRRQKQWQAANDEAEKLLDEVEP